MKTCNMHIDPSLSLRVSFLPISFWCMLWIQVCRLYRKKLIYSLHFRLKNEAPSILEAI